MSLIEYSATDGAALAERPADDPATPEPAESFARLELDNLMPSPTNPRKTFDQAKLAELAESIKASGVHQPILVRPRPDLPSGTMVAKPVYEIVSGERRYRASLLAGMTDIPAMIRPLTTPQVLEIQLVENLQRDDLSPLEEAEGYARLVAETGLAKEDLGARIGRSRGYVYQRLKLLDLCQEARNALAGGKIDASVALHIARIPTEPLQLKALHAFSQEQWTGDRMSARAAKKWIDQHVMIRLAQAPFDGSNAKLVPAAGSCDQCPKRTGAAPDLFSDYDVPDLCTDRACYDGKVAAHHLQIIEKARAKGMKVIEGDEAKEAWPRQWGALENYTAIGEPVSDDEGKRTLADLLTRMERAQIQLLVNPHDGEPLEVVPDEIADAAYKRLHAAKSPKDRAETARAERDRRAAQHEYEVGRLTEDHAKAWRQAASKDLVRAVLHDHRVNAFTADMLRVVLLHVAANEAVEPEAVRLGLGMPEESDVDLDWESLKGVIATIPDVELGPRLLAMLVVTEAEHVTEWKNGKRQVGEPTMIEAVAKAAGVDLQAYQDDAREALQDRFDALTKAEEETLEPREATGRAEMPVGTKVRFKVDLRGPGGKMRKVAGRDGKVDSWMGDGAVTVRYGTKDHEIATADWSELLLLAAPAAAATSTTPKRRRKASQAGIAAGLQALEEGTPEAALAGSLDDTPAWPKAA